MVWARDSSHWVRFEERRNFENIYRDGVRHRGSLLFVDNERRLVEVWQANLKMHTHCRSYRIFIANVRLIMKLAHSIVIYSDLY